MNAILFREDFSSGLFTVGPKGGRQPWFYHQHHGFVGRDPKATMSITTRGLSIAIPHYTLSASGMDDHIKLLFWRNEIDQEGNPSGTKAPEDRMLVYQVKAEMEPLGTEMNPFSVPSSDYRLSCGGILSTDLEARIGCHFFFTSTRAFAVYERYLLQDRETNPGAFFCYVIPVSEFPAGSMHVYRIGYMKSQGSAHWWIDGRPVMSIANLGRRLGAEFEQYSVFRDLEGPEAPPVLPSRRIFGAGLFTLLDAGSRTGAGLADLEQQDLPKQTKVFGQGGRLLLGGIEIGIE